MPALRTAALASTAPGRALWGALGALGLWGCGTAECPAGTALREGRCLEADAAGPAMDAPLRPDADLDALGLDALGLDAHEVLPDAWSAADAWAPDAGSDGGPCSRCPSERAACFMDGCVECVSDGDCAGRAGRPVCDVESHTCVACNVGSDCASPLLACLPDNTCVRCDDRSDCTAPSPACVDNDCVECESRSDCAAPRPACVSNACLECEANTDCASVSASRCEPGSHRCAACTADADCAHLLASPVCDEGRGLCVECTLDTEAARCGANSCNPASRTCTAVRRGSVGNCLSCNADSECIAGATCAPVNPARGVMGHYCLPIRSGPFCSRPFFEVNTAPSASGASVTYCRHRTTTCEGFLDFSRTGDGTCTGAGGTDASCGAAGVTDGLCRVSGGGNRCTHPCLSDDDCRVGSTCQPDPMDGTRNICSL